MQNQLSTKSHHPRHALLPRLTASYFSQKKHIHSLQGDDLRERYRALKKSYGKLKAKYNKQKRERADPSFVPKTKRAKASLPKKTSPRAAPRSGGRVSWDGERGDYVQALEREVRHDPTLSLYGKDIAIRIKTRNPSRWIHRTVDGMQQQTMITLETTDLGRALLLEFPPRKGRHSK